MKRRVAVLAIIGILLAMVSCSFLPLDMLDDPADPEASSYQGFHLTDDPDKIVLSIADNTRIAEPTLIFSKVIGAEKYQIQIASDEESLDSAAKEESDSNVVDVNLKETHHPRYWRARAFINGKWGAWSKTGTFIYLHPKTVYFDSQGGNTPNQQFNAVKKDSPYGPLPDIEREGKVFDGWWTEPEGKGEQIFNTTIVATDESHILYAKWLDTYLVTYDGNGNTGGAFLTSILKAHGKALKIQNEESLERTGYYFAEWNTKADGTGKTYVGGSDYTEDRALTLYAYWRKIHEVGKTGPAGGYVFYDKGRFSDGWRYLEAAPAGWSGSSSDPFYTFGYYRKSDTDVTVETHTVIGSGKTNTQGLVSAMGDEAYSYPTGIQRAMYAAKAASDCTITVGGVTYDDWFLSSKDELSEMYENLKKNNLGGFSNRNYWSSSMNGSSADFAWMLDFDDGYQGYHYRYYDYGVRPVRAF